MKNIHLQEDCLKRLSQHGTLHTEMCFTRSATKAHKGYMSVRLYLSWQLNLASSIQCSLASKQVKQLQSYGHLYPGPKKPLNQNTYERLGFPVRTPEEAIV